MLGMFEKGGPCGWNRVSKKAAVGDEVRGATGSRSSRGSGSHTWVHIQLIGSVRIILMPGPHPRPSR